MKAKDIGYVALATALLAVSAWIAIPVGEIPITLQTATALFLAGFLGWKRAALAILAYILLGTIGVPVFAGFTGGAGRLFSPTGGFIFGFLPLGLTVGGYADIVKKKTVIGLTVAMILGVLFCYALGMAWFTFVSGGASGFFAGLTVCVFPYLPFEGVKIFLAVFLVLKVSKFIKTA